MSWSNKTDPCRHGYIACVHGSTNGTNGIPMSFKVLPMVPLVTPLVPMVMPMVPLTLQMVPLVSQWYHWLPMVPLVKFPMVPLGEPRADPLLAILWNLSPCTTLRYDYLPCGTLCLPSGILCLPCGTLCNLRCLVRPVTGPSEMLVKKCIIFTVLHFTQILAKSFITFTLTL